METHNINLNIPYSVPKEIWDKLAGLYSEMPYWNGLHYLRVKQRNY